MMLDPLKAFISWATRFYPNVVFYPEDFAIDLTVGQTDKQETNTLLTGIAAVAGRTLEQGDELTATFQGVTNRGKKVGDFTITLKCDRKDET